MTIKVKEAIHIHSLHPYARETVDFLCGVEYEIESLRDLKSDVSKMIEDGTITMVDDGSLRNAGKEFITCPGNFTKQILTFERLHAGLSLGNAPYSERTSIHVHVNVANLTMDQLEKFVHLYIFLEPSFFYYAGENRKNNIHCVPLSHTFLAQNYRREIAKYPEFWSKYTAFNMCPVYTQGTVEFRHMYGHDNTAKFSHWLQMIRSLYDEARNPENSIEGILDAGVTGPMLHESLFNEACPLTDEAYIDSSIDLRLAYVNFS